MAGTISITTQAVTRVEGETLLVVIQVTNRGDAAAHQVRVDAEVLGERFGSQVQASVSPSQTTEFIFNKAFHPSLKGTFPMKVLVHFQDANGYPFSALTCTTFFVREKGDANISATAAPLSMKDNGVIQFRVQNTGAGTGNVKATLHLPNEFSSDRPSLYFSLQGGASNALSFPIRNLSALFGATYPVSMVLENENGLIHSTSISGTLVKLVNDGNWFRKTRWLWAGGAVFLFVFLITPRKYRKKID